MQKFAEKLGSGNFVITSELNPPKGTNLEDLLEKANKLDGIIDAFNITDSHASRMAMSPLAPAHILLDHGIEPILQMACRDKNRIALQSDVLSASALGISNILCMTGDHPSTGDHPEAKPVFDLEAIALLKAFSSLNHGKDLNGNQITSTPSLCLGAVVNPGSPDLNKEIKRMEEKIEAGATFFQTQAIYDLRTLENFMNRIHMFKIPIIVGFIVLKSAKMARGFNENLPGVDVPEEIILEMEESDNPREKSTEIASRIIKDISPICQGIHIMAIGWESQIPSIVESAGIAR